MRRLEESWLEQGERKQWWPPMPLHVEAVRHRWWWIYAARCKGSRCFKLVHVIQISKLDREKRQGLKEGRHQQCLDASYRRSDGARIESCKR